MAVQGIEAIELSRPELAALDPALDHCAAATSTLSEWWASQICCVTSWSPATVSQQPCTTVADFVATVALADRDDRHVERGGRRSLGHSTNASRHRSGRRRAQGKSRRRRPTSIVKTSIRRTLARTRAWPLFALAGFEKPRMVANSAALPNRRVGAAWSIPLVFCSITQVVQRMNTKSFPRS